MLSIITPVLNGARFIGRNIRSIEQLSIEYQHIVVDGGSTDGTQDVVGRNKRVVLVEQRGATGMYGAINQGIRNSEGDYCAYVNCDDAVVPEGYEAMYRTISSKRLAYVYSDAIMYYEKDRRAVLCSGVPFSRFFLRFGLLPFVQSSGMISRKAFEDVGGFREKYKLIGDLDFFSRIAKCPTASSRYVRGVSSIFLKYGGSLGDRNAELYLKEMADADAKRSRCVPLLYSAIHRCINMYNYRLPRSANVAPILRMFQESPEDNPASQ